jgi:uncharacterized membrane protein YgdD (TMEM256/DUF423 family)
MGARPMLRPVVVAVAGGMGLAGTALAAAGAHLDGGALTRLAAEFLLIHAAALLGLAVLAGGSGWAGRLYGVSACLLGAATIVFSTDLALAGLLNWRPFAPAAPLGGTGLLVGWLGVVAGAIADWREP